MDAPGYWRRLFAALRGRDGGAPAPTSGDDAGLRARIAALEMDLGERVRQHDERIEAMRQEYERLQLARAQAASGAGEAEIERLFKKLAGPLSNLVALSVLATHGQSVETADVFALLRDLEKELARFGLEPIGAAGEGTAFDIACHQRMSGGSVHAGTPVVIRLPGYRLRQKVLLKAMVSTSEE